MRAGLSPPAPRHAWRRRTASRPIVGERNGSRTPSATSWTDPQAGERRAGASVSSGSKLDFRLEHELQPWWDGSAPPRGITRLLALSARSGGVDHRRRRARFRLPFSFRIGLPPAPLPATPVMSAGAVASGVRYPWSAREHCGGYAGCPDGDRNGTCQQVLLKAPGGELASRSGDLPRDLRRQAASRPSGRIFPAPYLVI